MFVQTHHQSKHRRIESKSLKIPYARHHEISRPSRVTKHVFTRGVWRRFIFILTIFLKKSRNKILRNLFPSSTHFKSRQSDWRDLWMSRVMWHLNLIGSTTHFSTQNELRYFDWRYSSMSLVTPFDVTHFMLKSNLFFLSFIVFL
jgi:hypothetical protein